MELMTITRALAELKLLDKRITKEIVEFKPIGLLQTRKNMIIGTNKTIEQFEAEAISQFSSIKDLIKRRADIKAAIIKSNSETPVKINNTTMTVAEAIDRKTSIAYEKKFKDKINIEGVNALSKQESHNTQLQSQVEQMLIQNYGKDRKANSEEYDAISKPFLEANEIKLIDPLDYNRKHKEIYESIENFESEIDFVLSESNAKTKIKI